MRICPNSLQSSKASQYGTKNPLNRADYIPIVSNISGALRIIRGIGNIFYGIGRQMGQCFGLAKRRVKDHTFEKPTNIIRAGCEDVVRGIVAQVPLFGNTKLMRVDMDEDRLRGRSYNSFNQKLRIVYDRLTFRDL